MGILLKALSNASDAKGSLVIIAGEAGIGKTRITEEVAAAARSTGFSTFAGRCLPGSPYAYLPFRQAFQHLASIGPDGWPQSTNMLISSGALDKVDPRSAYSDDSSLRDSIHLSTLSFIRQLSNDRPVLIILEDLQWSDGASSQLLRFLARNIRASRVLILGNYRSEDVLPVEGRGLHPLIEILRGMRAEGAVTDVSLGPLDENCTITAIEAQLGGRLERSIGTRIYAESEGNPLFALETAFLLARTGRLVDVGGTWQASDDHIMEVPTTVREVVLRRLDNVPSDARRVIEVASAVGVSFTPDTLLDVMAIDRQSMTNALETLELQHHLLRKEGERYSFGHEKVLSIIYESISRPRRRELHNRIGHSLEARGGQDASPGVLSDHFYQARIWGKCLANSLLAGEGLLKMFAATEALPFFLRAQEALESDPTLGAEGMRVLEGLADAYQETLDFAHAEEIYVRLLPLIGENNDRARVLRKRMWCWDHDRLGNGSLEMQMKLIEEGLAIPDVEPLERGEILSCKSSLTLHRGDAERAKALSEEAITVFRQNRSMPRLAWELVYCGYIALSQMEFDEALRLLSEAKEILKEHPWSMAENDADQHYGRIMVYQGKSNEAIEQFSRSLERSLQLGEYRVAGIACYYIALAYEEEGDMGRMETWINEGLRYASQGGYRPQMAMLELLLAHSAAVKDDATSAEHLLLAAKELYSNVHQGIRNFASGMLLVVEGEVHMLAGKRGEGERLIRRGLSELGRVPNGEFYEAISRRWFGDILSKQSRFDEAREQFSLAQVGYSKLGNKSMVDRIDSLLAKLGSA